MTTTVDAIYKHGKLVLPRPLPLPEKSHVRVTIESEPERDAWLKLSEDCPPAPKRNRFENSKITNAAFNLQAVPQA